MGIRVSRSIGSIPDHVRGMDALGDFAPWELVALADHHIRAPTAGWAPGAEELDVVARLQHWLAESPRTRARYLRGLAAIDRVSRRIAGSTFADLDPVDQFMVLYQIDRVVERTRAAHDLSGWQRAIRGMRRAWYAVAPGVRSSMGEAARFLPHLVDDLNELFCTSRVGWDLAA